MRKILLLLVAFASIASAQVTTTPMVSGVLGSTISNVNGVTVGGTLATDAAFYVTGSPVAGIRQYGFRSNYTSTTGATTAVNGFRAQDGGASGSYTTAYYAGFEGVNYTLGSSQTLTAQYGITVGNLTSGTSNYGIESELTAGAGKWNLYMTGTAQNYMAGALSLGSTTLTVPAGGVGFAKITADGAAPGAGGAKLQLVCGTNAGTAKLVISAGTSATTITITDNIGAGVTGC